MESKTVMRLGAVIFVALALTATAIEITWKEETLPSQEVIAVPTTAPDPMREGLRYCQQLGEAGARDKDCLRLWAENRERFLGIKPPAGAGTTTEAP